jgi:hypothetical protein
MLGSSVNTGTRTTTVPPRHRPGDWLLRPVRDASSFREPTPLLAFVTTREAVGYLLENRGSLRQSPRLTFREIGRPVGLLDGSVELASLSCEPVHPAPQGAVRPPYRYRSTVG